MSNILYVALASPDPAGGYRATFPDLPGVTAEAPDVAQLLVAARAALLAHLLELSGDAWPDPTPVERMQLPPAAIPLLVDVAVEDAPVRVNISLGERLLQRLDAAAEARGMTRSGFIAQAVRVSLGERAAGVDFEAATRRLQEELGNLGRRINESLGPDSAFSRRMSDLDGQIYDRVMRAADSVSAAMARRRDAARGASETRRDGTTTSSSGEGL